MHERRAKKLYGLIAARPRNAYELAQEMWGNVAVTQAFLTLSEVLGHVDLLIDEGRVGSTRRTVSSISRQAEQLQFVCGLTGRSTRATTPSPRLVRRDISQEQPVQAIVAAELGVEGDREHAPWRAATACPSTSREDLDLGAVLGDPRRPDEDASQRAALDAVALEVGLEAADLAPEGVALGAHVHDARCRGRA